MNDLVRIRGYAVPFLRCAQIGSGLEYFEPGAFTAMLKSTPVVSITAFDHYAPSIDVSVDLFADDYGIGFEAEIARSLSGGVLSDVRSGRARCSIGGLKSSASRFAKIADGRWATAVTEARFSEITITPEAAYEDTACWAPDDFRLPRNVSRYVRSWEAGKAAWDRRQSTMAWIAARRRERAATGPRSHFVVKDGSSGRSVRLPFRERTVNSMARQIVATGFPFQPGTVMGMPTAYLDEADRRARLLRHKRGT